MQKKKREPKINGDRLTKNKAYPLIEQYLRSGLEPREFYNQVGWTDNQFFSWRKRYIEEHNLLIEEPEQVSFHPINITSSPKESIKEMDDEFIIDINYPNGVSLRVYSKNTTHLMDLIKLY